ncbi:transcription initiation factor tfiid [Anaeramoeba flamelloides]|uniref:Transcription initiation factor tfiid n=1 Tax=Anaeramoeba flamelloides TaxID=1746091 RepID=A0AAV7YLB5_9EUKA|nr:transcription initiation factor tfiid [Anaeramoeba flamelloides]
MLNLEKQINYRVMKYLENNQMYGTLKTFENETSLARLTNNQRIERDSLVDLILFDPEKLRYPQFYFNSYQSLKNWINTSLKLFQDELRVLLYPIFLHCYFDLIEKQKNERALEFFHKFKHDHLEKFPTELGLLQSITTKRQMETNNFATTTRSKKFNIILSSHSFELYFTFLQEMELDLLNKITYKYLNIRVISSSELRRYKIVDDNDETEGEKLALMTGETFEEIFSMNSQKIEWGLLKNCIEDRVNEKRERELFEKKERILAITRKRKRTKAKQFVFQEPLNRTNSLIPAPKLTIQENNRRIDELSRSIDAGENNLPSICMFTLFNSQNKVNSVDISKDSRYITIGCSDSSVRYWDLTKQLEKKKNKKEDFSKVMHGHQGEVYSVKISPLNHSFVSVSQDGTARLWSFETDHCLSIYNGHNFPIWDVDFSPFGYYFVTGSMDKTAMLWSTDSERPHRLFVGHLSDVDCVKFHPNSNYVATGSSDRTVRLWSLSDGKCVRIFADMKGHKSGITSLAFSPDGQLLASGDEDGVICLWDIGKSMRIRKFNSHDNYITCMDFSVLNGNILASGSVDNTVKIWNVELARKNPIDIQRSKILKHKFQNVLLKSFPTKNTPVLHLGFSMRNILHASGVMTSEVPNKQEF